jgi:hypothetical protein
MPPPAEKLAVAVGPVVGPPTTQTSLALKGIVNVFVPFCGTLDVVVRNATETPSFIVDDE